MVRQRALLLLASLATGALALVLLTAFVWPDGARRNPPPSLNLGPIEQFAAGEAVPWRLADEEGADEWVLRTPRGEEPVRGIGFWVVRLESGEVRALYPTDPYLGCTVPWRDTFTLEGRKGFFRDPCHGSTYTLDGRWVAGPSHRDLDWLAVHVEPDGEVIVDLTRVHAGQVHAGATAWNRAQPDIEGWSAAP